MHEFEVTVEDGAIHITSLLDEEEPPEFLLTPLEAATLRDALDSAIAEAQQASD